MMRQLFPFMNHLFKAMLFNWLLFLDDISDWQQTTFLALSQCFFVIRRPGYLF